MKKIVLLASLMALAALMLAAAPAFAQTERVVVCHKEFGQGAAEFTLEIDRSALEAHLDHGDTLGPCEDDGNGDDGDDGDDDDRDRRDRDRFIIRDDNVADVVPVVEIDQETEQECESGDVDQSVNVSQTGDNSIQTVGAQPTANTGCAQNALGVIDAGPFVGDFAGDNTFVVQDDDNGFDDGRFIRCDEDGDGNNDDDCDDDCFVFDHDNGDDDCFVFDHDNDNDRLIIRDGGDRFNVGDVGNDLEIEDVNSTIDVSPNQTVTGDSEINQAAAASSTQQWVLTPHGWVLM